MKDSRKFGIKPKIIIGYAGVIVCLVIVFLILNMQIGSLQAERNQIIKHEMDVNNMANRLESYFIDMETGQRGYLITGKETYLNPFFNALSKWEDSYAELADYLRDDKEQVKRLGEIKTTIRDWIKNTGEPAIAAREDGNRKEIEALLSEDPGKEDMNKRRRQFEAFRKSEQMTTQKHVAKLDERNKNLTIGLFSVLILIAGVSIVIAYVTARSITRTVNSVTNTIRGLAHSSKDLKKRIHVKTRDEIRDLGEATNELLDIMEKRDWLQVSVAEILKSVQGVALIDILAKEFLGQMARNTNAAMGAFYIRQECENGIEYEKVGSFADSAENIGRERFKAGEGLIGQCAEEMQMHIIQDIPENYRVIGSGLGEVKPKSILVAPVIFEGKAVAILELATLDHFTEDHIMLFQEISETFGVIVHSVMNRMEVVRLLKDSQTMTEELQAQHEELQTQSEELRMQSEELQTTNDQLEDRTTEAESKALELEMAKRQLEDKNDELRRSSSYKSEFLANMSHELRTPLNSILILSEMLYEAEEAESETAEYAKIIQSSGKDLLGLINDILDLSKVEAGKIEVVIDELNTSEFAELTQLKFNHQAAEKGISLVVEKDPKVPEIFHTDSTRLQQIAKNLLSNALKFTEAGEVKLQLTAITDSQMAESMRQVSDEWIALSVSDTGIGIPPEKHALIFEAFQQADGATSRKYGGTGLGLSICAEFAKLLGGSIMVESEEGKGSKFTVLVPSLKKGIEDIQLLDWSQEDTAKVIYGETALATVAATEEVEVRTDAIPDDIDIFAGKHVLLTDDDPRNIFALKKVLEKNGMHVIEARDGIECLETMQQRTDIDIVLMDIMMPRMDGYEAISTLRNELGYTNLPIIALTAKAMKQDRERCLEAGASDYISKPIVMEQLLSAMRVWLAPVGEEVQ
ncbi:ATP-binding protein [Aciduricibacillus chroicocephali]|uniref:histidine kinase n=1 Tax=Aciduricibacillus chroicocephali TaxID=3054939 RepID=A0ABY9KWA7_9BACI|nr:ATP-binding protein [Bacillaceae bacterium 44XB]